MDSCLGHLQRQLTWHDDYSSFGLEKREEVNITLFPLRQISELEKQNTKKTTMNSLNYLTDSWTLFYLLWCFSVHLRGPGISHHTGLPDDYHVKRISSGQCRSIHHQGLLKWRTNVWTLGQVHTCSTNLLMTGRPSNTELSKPLVSTRTNPSEIIVSKATTGFWTISKATRTERKDAF